MKRLSGIAGFLIILLASVFQTATASEQAEGTFTAAQACEAYLSFRREHNPGDIRLTPGATYTVREVNKQPWQWLRVEVPGIERPQRWIAKACGAGDITVTSSANPASGHCKVANTYDSNVLAVTWQPGFCEHFRYNGTKPECDALNSGELVITHLTLHGLWPNKDGCPIDQGGYGYCPGSPMDLSEQTIRQIGPWMPNFLFETDFGQYQWNKHGSCQSREDDEYFLLAVALTKLLDQSAIGAYLRDHQGQTIVVEAFENHLEEQLGPQVTAKLQLNCTGFRKRYLQEIRVQLPKVIPRTNHLEELVRDGRNVAAFRGNCDSQVVIEDPGE
ncbi:MAG: ribonuclease T2 family protein [Gammaproteobacteria bacterium]